MDVKPSDINMRKSKNHCDNYEEKRSKWIRSRYLDDVVFKERRSLLDSHTLDSTIFYGLGTILQMIFYIFMARIAITNFRETGYLCGDKFLKITTNKIGVTALIIIIQYVLSYSALGGQILVRLKFISREFSVKLQIICLVLFYLNACYLCNYFNLGWFQRIQIFLFTFSSVMKQYSYTFTNNYLWSLLETAELSKKNSQIDYKESQKKKLRPKLISLIEKFPESITFSNYFVYTIMPVFVYNVQYPRTVRINYKLLLNKVLNLILLLLSLRIIMEEFIIDDFLLSIPASSLSASERLNCFIMAVFINFKPQLIIIVVLVFYIVFDLFLNILAELTFFSDRYFYGPWWNISNWIEFYRHWNLPVHYFIVRHVYHPSVIYWNLTPKQGVAFSLGLSAVIHELIMSHVTQKYGFYMFVFQISHLILGHFSQAQSVKDRRVLQHFLLVMYALVAGTCLVLAYIIF